MENTFIAVVTTIQEPTDCVRKLAARLGQCEGSLIVIGDKKGPARFDVANSELVSIEDQRQLPFGLSELLPTGHYARKNLGYLLATSRGAECVYETDDDNAPAATWKRRELSVEAQRVEPRPWLNVFRLFSDELIWPRGFPLEMIRDEAAFDHDRATALSAVDAPIQQGLADNAPDVDAVWRLVLDREFNFEVRPSVWLPPRTWSPFNSQSTWWWPPAYSLMYLPSYCSFRMTDIWRSFIAQRCLWEMGYGLVFHAAEVVQDRNVHDLMRDFRDEVPGYEGTPRFIQTLDAVDLEPGADAVRANLIRCYEALVAAEFFPAAELSLVEAWLDDLQKANGPT